MKRARFIIDPRRLFDGILPPGNELTGVAVLEDGFLACEFKGIDAPIEAAETTPMMILLGLRTDGGMMTYWFEAVPASCLASAPPRARPRRRRAKS